MNLLDIPESPTNVRLIRDGKELPVDVIYTGRRPDGTEVFTIANAAFLPGDQMRIGTLPPRTTVIAHSPRRPR